MSIALNPYLQFDGNTREAMDFYHRVLGGELSSMTFGEGMGDTNPDTAKLIMHSSLYLERGIHLMAADVPPGVPMTENGTISLSSDDAAGGDAEMLSSWWEHLLEDADVSLPLEQAPWGDRFGQLTDRFGVTWMVNIPAPPQS
ncbi:MAG: VOC family protein [Arachnia sp.]